MGLNVNITNDLSAPGRLDEAFNRLIANSCVDLYTLCHRAKVPYSRNLRFSNLDFNEIDRLCINLNLSFERVLTGDFCYDTLDAHFNGETLAIPVKYRTGMNSKMFTLRHIYDVAERKGFGDYLLSHFQITRDTLSQDIPISVELASDVLRKFSYSSKDLLDCGAKNPIYLRDSNFGKKLSEARGNAELMEHWISVSQYLEKNWSYKIEKVNKDECILNGYNSEEMLDVHKKSDYSCLDFTLFRVGSASMFSTFIGGARSLVTLTKSIHRGDAFDQFTIKFVNN